MNKTHIVSAATGPRTMKLAALLGALIPLVAQGAEPVPGAGTILRQVQPPARTAPSSTGTGLTIEQQDGSKLPPSAPFVVTTLQISGNTLFDTPTLHALVTSAEGTSMTLTQLNVQVTRITDYYRDHGYPLARAILPAQTIQSGVVRIEIIEAHFGRVILDNDSRVTDRLPRETLLPLQSGSAISQRALDHSLLLLSDIPGVAVSATLRPGDTVGTSDLLVNVTPDGNIDGNFVLDNYGNRYTGEAHAGATVNFNNPLHQGDTLSLSALTSGEGLNYGSLAYDLLLNGEGTRMGGSYSALHYRLGGALDALDAHGTANVGSVWAMHPLVRSRLLNLYGLIQYDHLQLRDRIDTSSIRTDRHLGNGRVSLTGDVHDDVLQRSAVSTWNVSWTRGLVGFDNDVAQADDAATASTQGRFSKWNLNVSRLQALSSVDSLYLAFSRQWAYDNLDASEKMIAGGPFTVRGYDMGALSGDSGYLGTVELRHDLVFAWTGQSQFQLVAFVDSSRLTINETAWVGGTRSAKLSGAGVGFNWAGADQWHARTYVATRLGPTSELVADNSSTRAWLEFGKGF